MTRRVDPGFRHRLISVLISVTAGALAGTVFWTLHAPSPAPPWLGLTGLLGIVLGEAAGTALRDRLKNGRGTTARTQPPTSPRRS